MKLEVIAICDPGATGQVFKRTDHPLPFLIEQQNAVQLLQRQHSPGKGFLQERPLLRTKTVQLNPVHQTAQHQVSLHERVFGLLRHGPRQVRRCYLRQAQVMSPGLFQLQVKQPAQTQTHRGNEQHRRLAQR
ncbi:hypothetical protein D3C84_702310 [compost metagenome]